MRSVGIIGGVGVVGNTQMSYTTADKVAVVEAFQGEQWLKGQSYRNPAYSTAQKVERGYLNHF